MHQRPLLTSVHFALGWFDSQSGKMSCGYAVQFDTVQRNERCLPKEPVLDMHRTIPTLIYDLTHDPGVLQYFIIRSDERVNDTRWSRIVYEGSDNT